MSVSLTPAEAKAVRDAIRTDYAIREDIWKDYVDAGEEEAAKEQSFIMTLLNGADEALKSVYTYPEEKGGGD